MLAHGVVHGDLSAYNILYWDGAITLIDFPQVVDVHSNRQSRAILERDVRRVCEYFAAQGIDRRPEGVTAYLWNRHVAVRERDDLADISRLTEAEAEE
jgi:RIO kinase 1